MDWERGPEPEDEALVSVSESVGRSGDRSVGRGVTSSGTTGAGEGGGPKMDDSMG